MSTIPANIDEVTPTWLSEVLGVPIDALHAEQIGQGVGIMGEIHRVTLTAPEGAGAPASVVVKLPSAFEANRAQGVGLGMYEAEVRFYAELGPRTPSGLPQIHRSEIVSGTADFIIVMEDLSRLRLVDQSVGIGPDDAAAALRVLADIHAAWWDRVDTDELAWIPSMVSPRIEMVSGLLPQLWPAFAANFEARLPEGGMAVGDWFAARYLDLMTDFSTGRPWTLAHQDFRVENIMFGDAERDEVVVLDWQGLGRGPGGYDVAYLLGGSLPIEVRRAHENALVAVYAERLQAHGVDYAADRVWDDYCRAMALGGLATSIFAGATLDLANERGFELISVMANRHFTAALDHEVMARY